MTVSVQIVDFTTTASNPTPAKANSQATSTITVTALNHFTGTVSLTDTVPTGLTCGPITPSTITGTGTATVSCTAATAGNYSLTVTGTSSLLAHSATAVLMFQDFNITSSSPSTVYAGEPATSTITVVGHNHFASAVILTDTVPTSLTCNAITPTSITGSGTATLSCRSTLAGNYTVTITGTSNPLSHSTVATFQSWDFAITVTSPLATSLYGSATANITVTSLNHFNQLVSLTASNITPPGLNCGDILPSIIAGTGTATISCSGDTVGNYTITLTGTSGTLSHNTTLLLTVHSGSVGGTVVQIDGIKLLSQYTKIAAFLVIIITIGSAIPLIWNRRARRHYNPSLSQPPLLGRNAGLRLSRRSPNMPAWLGRAPDICHRG